MLNDKVAHDGGFQVDWHDDCVDTTGKADFSNWLSSNNSTSTQDTVLGVAQHNAVMHMSDDTNSDSSSDSGTGCKSDVCCWTKPLRCFVGYWYNVCPPPPQI